MSVQKKSSAQSPESHPHGPANAEHELKKAYSSLMETGVAFFWDRKQIMGVNADEVVTLYKRAFHAYRSDDKLSAERWARTVKHLSRAFWHEAKIAYVQPRSTQLPFLEDAFDEYGVRDDVQVTKDLLDSLSEDLPPGIDEMPEDMTRYLNRGRRHLEILNSEKNELLRASHIQAAHEYGRVLECMALALEAELKDKKAA